MAERFLHRLCRPIGDNDSANHQVTARALIPRTCELVDPSDPTEPPSSRNRFQALSALSVGAFRSNLRSDFQDLGNNLLRVAMGRLTWNAATPEIRERLDSRLRAVFALDVAQAVFRVALLQGDVSAALDIANLRRIAFSDNYSRFDALWKRLGLVLPAVRDNAIRAVRTLRTGDVHNDDISALFDASRVEDPRARSQALVDASLGIVKQVALETCSTSTPFGSAQNQERVDECHGSVAEAFAIVGDLVAGRYSSGVGRILGSTSLREVIRSGLARRLRHRSDPADRHQQNRWLETALQFVGLAADIASANSSASVRQLFEEFAAPVGTWRGKHAPATWGLAFQGYAGLSVGFEWAETEEACGASLSPMLSFGFQFHVVSARAAARFVVYASLVDVGNVVSVSLDDDLSAESVPDITWAQLFSPGIHVGVSLGRSPVDVLAGLSYIPALRTVNGQREGATRLSVTLAIDVTLLRLAGN